MDLTTTTTTELAFPGETSPIGDLRQPDVYAWSRPAITFTGDFYFADDTGTSLRFCVGDVAGKGLPSAILMAMTHEAIEHEILERSDPYLPATLTGRLARRLHGELPSNRFVTLVAGRLDRDGTLDLANAGHCAAILRRRSGRTEALTSTGPVIGPLPRATWGAHRLRLDRGDTLVLYSDGVLEATATTGEEFGQARIESAVRRAPTGSARAVAHHLLDEVAGFLGSAALGDDTTVMAIRA